MPFLPVGNITINGSQQYCNGYVYGVDYNISLDPEPSKLTMHFISEDGTYTEPDLSTETPVKIEVGETIHDNFYAISYSEKDSSEGKLLEVVFWDGSIILDKYWVGLHKTHGNNPLAGNVDQVNWSQLNPLLIPSIWMAGEVYDEEADGNGMVNGDGQIIVGNEMHPCDINQDGVFDNNDIGLLRFNSVTNKDPCYVRCASEPFQYDPYLNDCLGQAATKVFPVAYRFSDLIAAITAAGIPMGKVPTPTPINPPVTIAVGQGNDGNVEFTNNDFYRASHSGPLRSVLKDWCDTLGLTFYWENDCLNFADVSKPIQIQVPSFPCVESRTHSKTLEGTIRKGAVSSYIADGKIIERDCKEGRPVALQCLTLRDLYGDTWYPQINDGLTGQPQTQAYTDSRDTDLSIPPLPSAGFQDQEYIEDCQGYKPDGTPISLANGIPIELLENSVICAHYDNRLRMMYLLQNYYGLQTIPQYVALKNQKNNQKGPMRMDRLGTMSILSVLDSAGTDRLNGNAVSQYNDLLNSNILKPDERQLFKSVANGFFIVVKMDIKKYQDLCNFEEHLSNDFMGKHWVRQYFSPYYGEDPEITPSCNYLGANVPELKDDVGFVKFRHSVGNPNLGIPPSNVYNLAQLLKMQYSPGQADSSLPAAKQTLEQINKINTNRKCLIYYQSPTSTWIPDDKTTNYFTSLINSLEPILPRLCSGITTDVLQRVLQIQLIAGTVSVDDINQGRIQILALYPGTINITNSPGINPSEKDPHQAPIGLLPNTNAYYGLSSKETYIYTINGTPITLPAASSCNFVEGDGGASYMTSNPSDNTGLSDTFDPSTTGNPTAPYFTVIVAPTRKVHTEIPKIEAVMVTSPPKADALLTDYEDSLQIDQSMIKLLNNFQTQCVPDFTLLQQIHQAFNASITYSILQPYEDYTFTITGIDLPSGAITISTGLQSLSIRIDDKGVFSTYGIGNRKFHPISKDVLIKRLEGAILRTLSQAANQSMFGGFYPPIPQTGPQ